MSNQVNSLKKGLTVKDLVTTGIFSAIFFVFTLVGGLPFAPNPVLTFYMPMGAALLCADDDKAKFNWAADEYAERLLLHCPAQFTAVQEMV